MKILKVLTRICINPEALTTCIAFYEGLFNEPCSLRFSYPAVRLELAQVGTVLLLAGRDVDLDPFRATRITVMVDDIGAYQQLFEAKGVMIIDAPKKVPTGWNMRVKHPDGLIAEYVQHA